jgi:hypothetical protein
VKIENAFEVPAPPEAAWAILNDVPRVLPCMPGAELEEVVDQNTFKVTMHVKLGAVALRMATDVRREHADDEARTTVLVADAKDEKGRGGASATITSSLEQAGEGTRVTVVTELQLRGTLAGMGRGVVGAVASELVKSFAARLSDELHARTATGRNESAAAPPIRPIGGFRLLLRALAGRLSPRR